LLLKDENQELILFKALIINAPVEALFPVC
jgi:hypothetical protein